jgi:1,4-dihydroxy-2-naphthoate octaprenyltransferase
MKVWIQAARLRTLPLAMSSIIFGSACAVHFDFFNPWIFILALTTTICLQILSNFANDYGDALSGKDNEGRIGPSRAVSSGEISSSAMKKAMVIFAGFSFVLGLFLILLAFSNDLLYLLVFLVLGLAAIASAIKYTVGKNPYGYRGLGDLFVFLFFGLVGILGSYFLFSKQLDWAVVLPAISGGCLSVAVLNFNNMRDIENDTKTGKRTLAVMLGLQRAKQYQYILIIVGFFALIVFALLENFNLRQYLFLLLAPFFAQMIKSMIRNNNPVAFDPYLKKTALGTFGLSLLFLIAVLLG